MNANRQPENNTKTVIQTLSSTTRFNIEQTAATMRVESMPVSQQCIQNMIEYSSGAKTADQLAHEICERYRTQSFYREFSNCLMTIYK